MLKSGIALGKAGDFALPLLQSPLLPVVLIALEDDGNKFVAFAVDLVWQNVSAVIRPPSLVGKDGEMLPVQFLVVGGYQELHEQLHAAVAVDHVAHCSKVLQKVVPAHLLPDWHWHFNVSAVLVLEDDNSHRLSAVALEDAAALHV